jgi:hypothetical protein
MEKVKQISPETTFAYSHKKSANLLSDISDLEYDAQAINRIISPHNNLVKIDDTIYINTWYGQQHWKYVKSYETTFDCLYSAFDDSCRNIWGFRLADISTDLRDFFPIIDYSKYYIQEATSWILAHPEYKILIENGIAYSDQSDNLPMEPLIVNLAQKYPNKTFILTAQADIKDKPNNIIFSDDIIKKEIKSDLNEVSYLSTFCDMIIGKASGVFSFSFIQENLFNRNIKYICFCQDRFLPNKPNKFWLDKLFQDKINYTSNIIATNDFNHKEQIIEANL